MSVNPTGLANNNQSCFLLSTGSIVDGGITQRNPGVIMNLLLTNPIVLGAPFAPGGTAVSMNLALEPVGGAPHAVVALRLNFYDANGALIGVQDIA